MFRSNADATAVEMFPGVVRRTLNSGDRMMLIEVTLSDGAVVPEHTHPHEQVGYVANGRVRFEIDGETQELSAGDSYFIRGGLPHAVTSLGPSVCIDIFSPVREEYL